MARLARRSWHKKIDRADMAHDHGFKLVQLVSDEFDFLLGAHWHSHLHPVVGTSDGRIHPTKAKAKATCWRGGASTRLRATCRRLARLNARFEDSLFGDVLGVITLFVVLYGLLLAVPFVDGALK